MNTIRELWKYKNDSQGRINITLFFINIFLILSCIFLMVIYVLTDNTLMTRVNVVCLAYHLIFFFRCFKSKELYIGISFLEIFVHMILGIMSYGWYSSFQNWVFALIIATFLPSFKSNVYRPSYKRSFFYTSIIIISYFSFAVSNSVTNLNMHSTVDYAYINALFIFNNFVTFASIIMFSVFYTIRTEKRANELSRQAEYDQLTGLYNRYSLEQVAKGVLQEAKQNDKPYNVAIMDIDFFKDVNDTHGHLSGDDVLKEIANILRFSSKDIIPSRWGGEEFVLLAPHTVSYKRFMNTLERLRLKVSKTKFKIEDGKSINLTISIGATSSEDYECLDDTVAIADDNLYKAKKSGRNKTIG